LQHDPAEHVDENAESPLNTGADEPGERVAVVEDDRAKRAAVDLAPLFLTLGVIGIIYGAVVAQSSTRFILAGNHRWEAARREGATHLLDLATLTGAMELALGDFYARWRGRADPAAWTLLETAAGAPIG